MESRAHHVLIGVFTLVVIAVAVFFCLWLNGLGGERSVNFYTVVFKQSVSGLSRGSSVQYSGINVGDVVSLRLDPKNMGQVLVRIRIAGHIPIKQDTGAKLTLAGITGTSLIQLINGSPDSPLLVSKDDSDPIIIASPSPLTAFLDNGESFVSNINEVLVNAQQFLAPQNARNLALTLEHLEQATGALAAQRDHLGELVQQMKSASIQANLAMQQTNRLLSGPGTDVMNNLQQTMSSLAVSSQRIEQIIAQNPDALNNGVQSIAEIGPILVELRGTLASVRSMSRNLENSPRRFFLGSGNLQEFQP